MNGVLLADKPPEHTSFDVIARLRGASGIKRIGHTGTLDPMATGVLPVLFGRAAKFADLLPDTSKTYEAGVKLGITTDTLDITGKILTRAESNISEIRLNETLNEFRGEISQVPPMFSAVKIDGKRLHELARQGKEIERKPRRVNIYDLKLLDFDGINQEFRISVHCSAGTYIRTLCDDIGKILGTGAVLSFLRRTTACGFDISECVSLDECLKNGVIPYIRPVETALLAYPGTELSPGQKRMFINGVKLDLNRLNISEKADYYRVYSEGEFIGLAQGDFEREILKLKVLYSITEG